MISRVGMTRGERIFAVANNSFMLVLILLMVYPFWHIVMYSLSDVSLAARGGFFLLPRGFSPDTYRIVLRNRIVMSGFRVSVVVTVLGTAFGTLITGLFAYPLSKKRLRLRTPLTLMVFFTMLFSGGMIPLYLVVRSLGLLDSLAALIVPQLITAWNVFIMRNFFAQIPDSLEESARMDGANDIAIFFRIIMPISRPVIATIALFTAVRYWNDFFSTVLYITSIRRWSLQAVLRDIVSNTVEAMERQGVTIMQEITVTPQTIMMAAVVVTTVPILMVYPFLQKHFVHGILIGSLKG